MTKDEYTEVAETFRGALNALREVETEFCEVPGSGDFETLSEALDAYGYWLTSDELYELTEAIRLLERLTGRAFARSS